MRNIGKIIKVNDLDKLAKKSVDIIIREGQKAIERSERFMVALSGGLTPQAVYKLLASKYYTDQLDWTKVYIFFTDERCVPRDHSDSNYNMVKKLLLDQIPNKNVFRMQAEASRPERAAVAYEQTMKRIFNLSDGEIPQFDLMLLGIGEDGHVASLFPGSDALNEGKKLTVAPLVEKLNAHRISMTIPVISNCRKNVFIITGSRKNKIVEELQRGADKGYPIARIDFKATNSSWIIV